MHEGSSRRFWRSDRTELLHANSVLPLDYAKELHHTGYKQFEDGIKVGCSVPGGFIHKRRQGVNFTLVKALDPIPFPSEQNVQTFEKKRRRRDLRNRDEDDAGNGLRVQANTERLCHLFQRSLC